MNKINLMGIVMLLVLAIAGTVSASDLLVTPDSGSDLLSDDLREGNDFDNIYEIEFKFEIKNTNNTEDMNVTLSSLIDNVFDVVFSTDSLESSENEDLNVILAPGVEKTITVTAQLEEIDRTSDDPLTETGEGVHTLGNIQISSVLVSNNSYSDSATLTLQYENSDELLQYDESETYALIGSEEFDIIDETIEEVKPGDEIEVILTVENNFAANSNDADIEDLDISIDYDSNELDADDDSETISSISEDSTKDIKFVIKVPFDVASGSYDIIVEDTSAKDKFGGIHSLPGFTFTIEVEREEDEISINNAYLTQDVIACGQDKSTNLIVQIQNTGEDDQDGVAIRVQQSRLGIDMWVRDIEIESIEQGSRSSKHDETFLLSLPEDTEPGTYFLTITTYFSNNKVQSKVTDVPFEIEKCVEEETVVSDTTYQDTTEDIVPEVVEEDTTVEETQTNNEVTGNAVAKDNTSTSPFYTSLLILANIGLVVLIVGLGIKLFKRD